MFKQIRDFFENNLKCIFVFVVLKISFKSTVFWLFLLLLRFWLTIKWV